MRSITIIVALLFLTTLNCTAKTIVVAADGSGDFKTVQAAFNAVPTHSRQPFTIYVKNGTYREKLHLDSSKTFVTLKGESAFNTILVFNDHTGKVSPRGDTINTKTSYTFLVEAENFVAKNITFRNDAGINAGQAVAVEARGDKETFINCRFTGAQDILYLNNINSRQYYQECYFEGSTDFIFGSATAWFESCHIHSIKNSYITAASTPNDHPYGFIFNNCVLTADTGINRVFLGRPWRPFSCVCFIHCYLDRHILPEGWSNWNKTENYKTVRYTEYGNYGPGAVNANRVAWSSQLTDPQAAQLTPGKVLSGWDVEQLINQQ